MSTWHSKIVIRGVDKASAVINGVAKRTQVLQKAISKVGVGTQLAGFRLGAAVAFPVQQLGAAMTETAYEFSRAQNELAATLDRASKVQLGDIEGEAKRLAATNPFSTTEMLDAATRLGQAGMNTDQIMGSLAGTSQLATIAQMDLADAADQSTNVMLAFRLEMENREQSMRSLTRVNDALARAASSSNTTVAEGFEALKNAAPIAKSLNVSVEETVAMIGQLANAGFKAETAGVALRTSMLRMLSPTKEAREALRAIGIQLTDFMQGADEKLTGKGVSNYLQGLGLISSRQATAVASIANNVFSNKSLDADQQLMGIQSAIIERFKLKPKDAREVSDGMRDYYESLVSGFDVMDFLKTLSDQNVALGSLEKLFSVRHAGKMDVLIKNMDKLETLHATIMQEGPGSAASKAAIMMQGFKGAVDILRAAWEELKLSFTSGSMNDALIHAADRLRDLAKWFTALHPDVKKAIITFGLLAAALSPLLIYVGLMAQGVAALASVMGLFIPLMTGAALGAMRMAASATGAAAALVPLRMALGGIGMMGRGALSPVGVVRSLGAAFLTMARNPFKAIYQGVGFLTRSLRNLFPVARALTVGLAAFSAVTSTGEETKRVLADVWLVTKDIGIAARSALNWVFAYAMGDRSGMLKSSKMLESQMNVLRGSFNSLRDSAAAWASKLGRGMLSAALGDRNVEANIQSLTVAWESLGAIFTNSTAAMSGFAEAFMPQLSEAAGTVSAKFTEAQDAITEFLSRITGGGALEASAETWKEWGKTLGETVKGYIEDAKQAVLSLIETIAAIPGKIREAMTELSGMVATAVEPNVELQAKARTGLQAAREARARINSAQEEAENKRIRLAPGAPVTSRADPAQTPARAAARTSAITGAVADGISAGMRDLAASGGIQAQLNGEVTMNVTTPPGARVVTKSHIPLRLNTNTGVSDLGP